MLTVVGVLVIGYAALSQYSSSVPNAKGLGAGLSVGPVLLIGLLLMWRWVSALAALVAAILVVGGLRLYWPLIEDNYEWADLAEQVGAYGLVALSFARSLFGGRTPLCEQLAVKMHGDLTPLEIRYMRRATIVWVMFYVLMSAAIFVIFFTAPLRIWSMFVNFGTFGLIFLAGLVDHALRRRMLPRHPGGGILAAIRQALIG
jgi:uncharacterized membrane protein